MLLKSRSMFSKTWHIASIFILSKKSCSIFCSQFQCVLFENSLKFKYFKISWHIVRKCLYAVLYSISIYVVNVSKWFKLNICSLNFDKHDKLQILFLKLHKALNFVNDCIYRIWHLIFCTYVEFTNWGYKFQLRTFAVVLNTFF